MVRDKGNRAIRSPRRNRITMMHDLGRSGRRYAVVISAVLITLLCAVGAVAQTWPRCISGCTAKDVELVGVSADVSGSCSADGTVDATLWVSLDFHRNKSYCVRFVADVYIDGDLVLPDMVSEPVNVLHKGLYTDLYFGNVTLPCGSTLSLQNILIMWSVDKSYDPVSNCVDGSCAPYGPGSKCTGDQYDSITVPLPLDARDDAVETEEDAEVLIDVMANDLRGVEPTQITSAEDGAHGGTQVDGNGTITYAPDPNFYGTDTFDYTIEDADGNIATATVTVTVLPVNDAPMALDDESDTDANEVVLIDILGNDSDPDGSIDPTSVRILQPPSRGTADADPATGVVTYSPSPGACGTDTFTYVVEDNEGELSNEATVRLDVRCNEPPIANDDTATTDEGTSVGIDVVSNDADTDGLLDLSTVHITQSPASGTVSVHPSSGVVTYMPDPTSCGEDTFRYTVADDDGAVSDEATVTVSVLCSPPPLAIDDLYQVNEGGALDVDPPGVVDNDDTTPVEPVTVTLVSGPSHGQLTLHADGSFEYVHDGSETTSDQFTYYISDSRNDSNTATVSIIVQPINDPPVAIDDGGSTLEDTPVTLHVLDNDMDPDGDALTVDWTQQPQNGSVVNNGGTVTYTPNPNFHGVDTFTYAATDGNGGQSEATVTVTVDAVNDPPVAQDDSESTAEDTPVQIDVLANDTDPDGDSLSIDHVQQPSHGSASSDGSAVTYVPDGDFHGTDVFEYSITDNKGGTSSASVTVTIVSVDDPPVGRDDDATTPEDTSITIGVLDNDEDPEGDVLHVESVMQPAHGAVSNGGVDVTYTPDPDFNGNDSFTYMVSDGNGGKATATVYVLVLPSNDPPTAQDDGESTLEDTPVRISVLSNDSDPDGDELLVQSVTQPTHGTVEISGSDIIYLPGADFFGIDTFTYVAFDGNGGVDTATVTVDVGPVNDPPLAQDDVASTDEESAVDILVLQNDSDPDGDDVLILSVSPPSHGSVAIEGDNVVYTPELNFYGGDTFTYTIRDGSGATDTALVSVSVMGANDPPLAQDDSATTQEETLVSVSVLSNDSDPDGDFLTVETVGAPAHGSVINSGTEVSYIPDPGFNGVDTFTYTVSDGNGGSDSATVTISVAAVNDPPEVQDDSGATDEEVPVTIAVLSNDSDPDGDPLVIQSVTQPEHGSVINNGTDVTYSPDPGFSGIDTFTYTVSDGNGASGSASVTIVVAAVNDPPVAQDDSGTTDESLPVVIDVLSNDSDPDGDSLSVQSVNQPQHGDVVNNGGDVTYTPDPGFNGVDTFTYTVSDGHGASDSATVTVAVAAVNDPPVAQNDSDATDEETPVTIAVLSNDSDPDGDSLVIQSVTQPDHGSVVNNGSDVTYSPDPGFNGVDTFAYTISDGNGASGSASVTVAVVAVNDPPVAVDDTVSTEEDTAVTVSVLSNDSDPDGDVLTVQSIAQPSHGAAVSTGTSVLYTPNPNYSGSDAFTYTISDGSGGKSTATVTLQVLPVNDPPVAQDDSQTTQENTQVTVLVLSNDSDADGDALHVQSVVQPPHGSVTNLDTSVTYTPDPGFSGTDSFTYTVSDLHGGTSTARVTVSVSARNDPPVARNDSANTQEGELIEIPVLSNDSDPDGDFLLIESFTQPEHGSVINSRTTLSYVPDPGFAGVDEFTYTVSDGNGGSARATVRISVDEVNAPPVAQDDSTIMDEGTSVNVPVLLNDQDPDGDLLEIESVTDPENGQVEIAGTALVYVPNRGFDGVDTFLYTVSDGRGGTSTATVFVAVTPTNDAPLAQDDSTTTLEGESTSIPVLLNDSDPDGDPLTVTSVTQPSHGSVTVEGANLVYEPNEGFSGTDSFTYTVADGQGSSDTATVTVGVDPVVAGAGGTAGAASCSGRVVINELAWSGTTADPQDEWIELRNLGTEPVDLTGWVLRWRSTHPSTSEQQVWKVVELTGTLSGAVVAACDEDALSQQGSIDIQGQNGAVWQVEATPDLSRAGYYVLERTSNSTIRDVPADQLYDPDRMASLDLSDRGDIVMLLNARGEIVDTANASNLGRDGWAAGSASTKGSMERIDPLKPDTTSNWQTNLGLVIVGEDADGRPLRATPGVANSPNVEASNSMAQIPWSTVHVGDVLQAIFPLSRQERRLAGWPWIAVTRPGFAGLSGAGGSVDYTAYAFSGSYQSGGQYALDISTTHLSTGTYAFWIIYASGRADYIPVAVSP